MSAILSRLQCVNPFGFDTGTFQEKLANIIATDVLAPSFSSHATDSGLIQGLRPANERRCYFVMMSLIGWGQT